MDVNANPVLNNENKQTHTTSKIKFLARQWSKNKYIYIMLFPVLLYYLIFNYLPMYGVIISFQDYYPYKGVLGSEWAGLKWFQDFFSGYYFLRTLKNTLLLSFYDILLGFPAPIILALLLNEVGNKFFKRTVQTITYLPHFISIVVIGGIITNFAASDGIINEIIKLFGGNTIQFMNEAGWFRPIYIVSGIWQKVGWDSIIFLAALANVDPQLYESADIDGAGRFRKLLSITLPSIVPTIVIMLILRMGHIMGNDFQKILVIYNPAIYDTADVISTYIYRQGIQGALYSSATAVGLFNSVVNLFMLLVVNKISKKLTQSGLF